MCRFINFFGKLQSHRIYFIFIISVDAILWEEGTSLVEILVITVGEGM